MTWAAPTRAISTLATTAGAIGACDPPSAAAAAVVLGEGVKAGVTSEGGSAGADASAGAIAGSASAAGAGASRSVDADSAVLADAALTDWARTVRGVELAALAVRAGWVVCGILVVTGAASGVALGFGATAGDGVADGSTGSTVGTGTGKLVGRAIGAVTGSGSGVEAEAAWELSDSTARVRAGSVASARRVVGMWSSASGVAAAEPCGPLSGATGDVPRGDGFGTF
jgi:hypothetical protein